MRDKLGRFIKGHTVPDKWRLAVANNSCGNTYRRGTRHTEEANEKNRVAHLGKPAWNKGMTGEKAINWQGGKTSANDLVRHSKSIVSWREAVYARDQNICRNCHKQCQKGNRFAHHIYYFSEVPELVFSLKNGITLCGDCHKEVHRRNKSLSKLFLSVIRSPSNLQWLLDTYANPREIVGQNI